MAHRDYLVSQNTVTQTPWTVLLFSRCFNSRISITKETGIAPDTWESGQDVSSIIFLVNWNLHYTVVPSALEAVASLHQETDGNSLLPEFYEDFFNTTHLYFLKRAIKMALINYHLPYRKQAHFKPMSNWWASTQGFKSSWRESTWNCALRNLNEKPHEEFFWRLLLFPFS